MYKKSFKIVLIVVFSISTIIAHAQTKCDERIADAEKLYDEGKYSLVIEQMESIISECNLKGNKKYEVFKYLASANYELDELEKADKYMRLFLKKKPYYELNLNNDPVTFIERIDYFKKWPRLEIGLSGGKPFNNIIIDSIFPVLDTASTDYNQKFTTQSAYFASFNLNLNFSRFLSIGTGASYAQQIIAQTIPMFQGIDFNYSEKMKQIYIPLFLKFSYPVKSIVPSVYVGGEYIYMLSSEYYYNYTQNGTYDQKYEFLIAQRKRSDELLDLATERNKQRFAAIAGVQIAYKMKKMKFFANFKYRKEFNYFNNTNARYNQSDLFLTNYYVFPDIRFESYEVSLGFTYSFFYKVKSKY